MTTILPNSDCNIDKPKVICGIVVVMLEVVVVDVVEVVVEVVVDVDVVDDVVVEVEVVLGVVKLIAMLFPAYTFPLAGEGTKVLLPTTWFATWKEYWPGAVMKVMLFGAMALLVFPLKITFHAVLFGNPSS